MRSSAARAGSCARRRECRAAIASTSRSRRAGSERVSTELTFEAAQRELEQIVQRLESGDAALDEAIALWERGEELYRFCVARLDTAQGRIEQLATRVEAAKPS